MRDFLFRGKSVFNEEWFCGDLLTHEDAAHDSIEIRDYVNRRQSPVCPDTVGQYTGLTDKNGKKIFEGDILKICEYPEFWKLEIEWDIKYVEVHFNGGAFKLREYYSSDGYNELSCVYNSIFPSSSAVFEVIGNVYDTPELLKGG